MTGKVASLYYVEQCWVVCLALFMVIGSTRELILHSKNPREVKPIQKLFMTVLLVAGILELVWSIDPRGIWKILNALAIACIKDYALTIFSYCGMYYVDMFCRVVFESLGRTWVAKISKWITVGVPLLISIISQIWLTAIAVQVNLQLPRNYYVSILVFFISMLTLGITCAMLYTYSIRTKAGLNFNGNPAQRASWQRLVKLVTFLWLVVLAAVFLAIYTLIINKKNQLTFEDAQVAADPARYEFYPFLVLHTSGAILVYQHGKMRFDNSKAPAAITPNATDVIVEGKTAEKPRSQTENI
jgi:hypothetical protein